MQLRLAAILDPDCSTRRLGEVSLNRGYIAPKNAWRPEEVLSSCDYLNLPSAMEVAIPPEIKGLFRSILAGSDRGAAAPVYYTTTECDQCSYFSLSSTKKSPEATDYYETKSLRL